MIPIKPESYLEGGHSIIYGQDQPDDYDPLQAIVNSSGEVITEWEFTAEELTRIMLGGKLKLTIHTFNQPLQPIRLDIIQSVMKES